MPKEWTGDIVSKMHINGITYEELAAEMHCTKAYISMLLNSKKEPKGIEQRIVSAVNSVLEKKKEM